MTETPLEGLRLFRVSHPVERVQGVYQPSACGIVQGSKRAYLNGTPHVYDDNHYLLATMPTPLEGEVPEATQAHPVLGFLLDFDSFLRLAVFFFFFFRATIPAPPLELRISA